MVSAACWKAAREQARRAAEEVLLPGSNLQLWGIYVNLRVCADSHMASCRHMLATKHTIKMAPASGARSYFCSNCKTVQMQVAIFHQRSAEHVFCSFFLQIAVSFSCISFCDFAVESCSFGMHSGGTTGRRKEKTGRGGWAGIRVWASN